MMKGTGFSPSVERANGFTALAAEGMPVVEKDAPSGAKALEVHFVRRAAQLKPRPFKTTNLASERVFPQPVKPDSFC
jgi:hypothetical protein